MEKAPVKEQEKTTGWEVHAGMSGSGRIYICGPGAEAMQFVCWKENRIGRNIANKAAEILNRRHRDDHGIGPREIRAVLSRFGWDVEEFGRRMRNEN